MRNKLEKFFVFAALLIVVSLVLFVGVGVVVFEGGKVTTSKEELVVGRVLSKSEAEVFNMGAAASGYLLGGPRFGLLLGIVSAEGCRIPIIVEGSPQLVRATTADCEKLEEDEEIGIIKEVRSTRYHWSDEILYTETHYWIAP